MKGTHLPLTIKVIQAGYLNSPYFKDLYQFLSQNKLPSKRSSIKKVETLAESLVLLDSLIFKLVITSDKEAAVLAIPEICIDKIIALYHTSLFTGQSRCCENISYNEGQIFHSKFNALYEIFHKRMSIYANYLDLTNCQHGSYNLKFILNYRPMF